MDNVTSLLGNHFSPIMLALTPLGWVGDARGLLVLQALTLTGAAIPIYLIARDRFSPGIGLLWGAAYLIYPPTLYINLTDWHEIALAPPLLAFAIWFMLNKRYRWMLAMLLIALLIREEIGLIVSAFGLYLLLAHRSWWWGAPIAVGGFAFTAITTLLIVPAFGSAAAGDYLYLDRYGYLGNSVPEIALSLFSDPLLVLENLLVPDKMTFAALLFVPLGLLSLLGADLLILALPTLGYLLLSNELSQYDITSQYHAPLAPMLFAAAIIGSSRLARGRPRLGPAFATAGLVTCLAGYLAFGAGPGSQTVSPDTFEIGDRARRLSEIARQIPSGASVAAQDHLVPHLSRREFIYLYPWVNSPDRVSDPIPPDYILVERTSRHTYPFPSQESLESAIDKLIVSGEYVKTVDEAGFQLLKRSP